MEEREIVQTLSEVKVGTKLRVTWYQMPFNESTTSIGHCVTRHGQTLTVSYDGIGTYSLPPEDESICVTRIEIVLDGTRFPLKPVSATNRELPHNSSCHIYCDGGARPSSGGPAAAAVMMETFDDDSDNIQVNSHARFYASSTNNLAEFGAMIGALRCALKLGIRDKHPVIVTDSQIVYRTLIGESSVKCERLKPISDFACDLWRSCVNFCTIAHMHRSHGNPADKVATQAIQMGASIGEETLFPILPNVLPKFRNQPRAAVPTVVHDDLEIISVSTVDEYAALRRLSTRSTVPVCVTPHWAHQVKAALRKIHIADDRIAQEEAIIQFFLLPTRFLPANASTKRVIRHLSEGSPFAVNARNDDSQTAQRQHRTRHRVTEAVTRLALDGKIRSANKLLKQTAQQDDIPHEVKVQKLKEKINSSIPGPQDRIKNEDIPAFSGKEFLSALKKINRQAASSIDGWTKDMIAAAVGIDASIADDLAALCTHLLTQPVSEKLTSIIRAARFVGIPKAPNSVRPITISNLLVKIIGLMAIQRDDRKTSAAQYAVNVPNGCQRIIHEILQQLEQDPTLVLLKFDIRNAFGDTPREMVAAMLSTHDPSIRQYYRLLYDGSSPMVVYGPKGHTILEMPNGIRQGDSTSTYLFAHVVDKALARICQKFRAWMYVDDLTLVVHRDRVEEAIQEVAEAFAELGLSINPEKTRAFCKAGSTQFSVPSSVYKVDPFILLGADIAESPSFMEEKLRSHQAYFDLLEEISLHPQIYFTLLRMCGSPRLKYLCSVTPPEVARPLASFFDGRVAGMVSKLIDPSGASLIAESTLHDRLGAGIPCYSKHLDALYQAAKTTALTGVDTVVELVTNLIPHGTAQHNLDSDWMFYTGKLTPADFINAFGIRLGMLPSHLRMHPCTCACGSVIRNNFEQISHTFACDRFTHYGHTARHNRVRDTMIQVANSFGITCTKEPTCYEYPSNKRRPDILFHTDVGIAVDVSIVSPELVPGEHLQVIEKQKTKDHHAAVNAKQHVFYPAVFEAYGLFGKSTVNLIAQLARYLPTVLQADFRREMRSSIANALAQGRASAIVGTKWKAEGFVLT